MINERNYVPNPLHICWNIYFVFPALNFMSYTSEVFQKCNDSENYISCWKISPNKYVYDIN